MRQGRVELRAGVCVCAPPLLTTSGAGLGVLDTVMPAEGGGEEGQVRRGVCET